jgi:hypothetical protein
MKKITKTAEAVLDLLAISDSRIAVESKYTMAQWIDTLKSSGFEYKGIYDRSLHFVDVLDVFHLTIEITDDNFYIFNLEPKVCFKDENMV